MTIQIYDETFVFANFFVINDEIIFASMLQIHERIKNERIKAGLTEDEIAALLKIPRSTYQYWEEKTPAIEKIKKVARALNLPDDYFFVQNDEKAGDAVLASQGLSDPLPVGEVNITLKDYIDLLKYTNERLFATLNSTLGQIHSDQQVALAYQKAWVEYEAERASEGDESKKKKIMYKMSKLVDGKMKDKPSTGSPGETRK